MIEMINEENKSMNSTPFLLQYGGAKYVAPEPNIKTGWLSRYARMVTSANLGAVLK